MSSAAVALSTVPEVGASGTVRVRERVIDKVVREAAASVIGVPRGAVTVDVADWADGLVVRVTSGLPIPDLNDAEAIRRQDPVLVRVRRIQSLLAQDVERLTGRNVKRISVTISGAVIPERRRVR